TGILVGPGGRDGTDVPQPGSVINTPVLNNSDLAPGVVIMNNVVASFGQTGILFSGDSNRIGDPIVPFGRIINNTIAGTSSAVSDYGIRVTDYAGPTILNNIVTASGVGISIDATSLSRSVSNYNLFQDNTTNTSAGAAGTFDISLAAGQPLFVDRANYNFYLASGSRAIDSSIDSLADRSEMWPGIKEPLGIPPSPIITPARDRYAQLRDDDPNQAPPSGMGTNIFKDRGAIERADFTGPTARIVDPLDNTAPRDGTNPKVDGFYDYNAADHDVVVISQKTTDFAVQLYDAGGIGIDDLSVTLADRVTVRTNVVKVYRVLDLAELTAAPEADWPTLRLDADYLLDWDAANNILHVIPASGIWQPGYYYVIDVNNEQVRDLAGNPLQPNRSAPPFAGKTLFTVHLTGLDYGDLPDDPAGASSPDYATLLESGPVDGQGGPRHVVTGGVYLGLPPTVELDAAASADASGDYYDDGVTVSAALQMDSDQIDGSGVGTLAIAASTGGYLNAWIDFNGDGKFDQAVERIAEDLWLDAGENTLTVNVPGDAYVNPAAPGAADVYARGARFRFTSFAFAGVPWLGPATNPASGIMDRPAVGSEGIAYDGEVEDYMLDIVRYRQDWGDAPTDALSGRYLYPTLEAHDGATHYIHGPFLGSRIDAEMDGQPTLLADGDDQVGVDDEDGVEFVGVRLIPGDDASQVRVTLNLNGAAGAVLEGWIDFDGDGLWSDEYATSGVIDPAGEHDAFLLTAREPGQVGTRIGVVFNTGDALDVAYDAAARVLSIQYEPGVTTVAELVSAINAADLPVVADFEAAAENDGSGRIPSDSVRLAATWITSGGSETSQATSGVINPLGEDNAFEIIARDNTSGMNNKWITFYEVDNPGDPISVVWNGLDTLTVRYEPGVSTALAVIDAIELSGTPFTARLADPEPNDGSGALAGADAPDGLTISAIAAGPGAHASAELAGLVGEQNDFRVEATVPGEDGNFDLVFEHIATDDPGASWTPAVPGVSAAKVTVRLQPDVTTAAEIVQAINTLGQPVAASLLAAPNDGSGVFAKGVLARGPAYVTSGGDWAVPATIGPINPPGINNAFEVFATTNDPAHNGITVAFYEVRNAASVSWNGEDTLSVRFVPGVTTVQDIVNRINAAPGPLGAALTADVNDGSGVLGEDAVVFDGAEFLLDGAYERIFTNQVLEDGTHTYEFFVPESARPGASYARFRVSETGRSADGELLGPGGLATSGEVEDYAVIIHQMDYGDAPNSFGTVLERDIYGNVISDGARHVIAGPRLGELVDSDENGKPGPAANGDDNDGEADEDGVIFNELIVPGETVMISVTMGREGFDGRAQLAVDPSAGENDSFIVRAADYGDPLNGTLVSFLQVDGLPNDGSGTIAASDIGDGEEYPTDYGSSFAKATTGAIDPAGANNAFAIRAKESGGQYNGITVRFEHAAAESEPATASWNAASSTLLIVFKPGVATLNDLKTAVDAAGSPLEAAIIDDTNAPPVVSYDLDAPSLTVRYNPGATALEIVEAINASGPFVAELDLGGDPTNDGSADLTGTALDGLTGELAGGQWPGLLEAWVDFNANGVFEPGEQVFTHQPLRNDQLNTLSFSVPQDALPGDTYARFRITSDGLDASGQPLGPEGLALSGEVEDYLINVPPIDYGDAPEEYGTLRADDGARHVIAGPRLGTLVDHDLDGYPSDDALGDDRSGEDDEDGLDIAGAVLVPGEWIALDAMVTLDDPSGPAYLKGWIDYDGNGLWDTSETVRWGDGAVVSGDDFVDVSLIPPNADGTRTVHFQMPEDAAPGMTFLRFRISTDPGLSFDGLALDGEVEDYVGYIHMVDHGDAPGAGTAPHVFTQAPAVLGEPLVPYGPWMGTNPTDHDLPVDPSVVFVDDQTGVDDEDGVILFDVLGQPTTQLVPGEWATIQVTVNAGSPESGYLYAWIDYNGDGLFESQPKIETQLGVDHDGNEQIADGLAIAAGETATIDFFVPHEGIDPGAINARFRLIGKTEHDLRVAADPDWTLGSTGLAYSGEVEDYVYTILEVDYGDAANGPTIWADDGARHVIAGPWMSTGDTLPDWEYDGQEDDNAAGTAPADEDGVVLLDWLGNPTAELIPGQWAKIEVTVAADSPEGGRLYAWIDYDGDGLWAGSGSETQNGVANPWNEQIADGLAIAAGETATIDFFVPHEGIDP
ncbi:MAG: right-handed parallel beta-helix repeat-containing protein, partial [Pirellulaceae bacterium]|nr:right-handed parallel beta-helix repeat-containing protein [Pirellulaceae bacterium]